MFEPFAHAEAARLAELRLAALEDRLDADLALGRHKALVPGLEALLAEHRLRERFAAQLMLALYRAGRQPDASRVYRATERRSWRSSAWSRARCYASCISAYSITIRRSPRPPRRSRPVAASRARSRRAAHNLPVELTSFIGRERELEEIAQLLATARLLTLTGAGGSGKTRLALRVAQAALDDYPDGVWLVGLAALADPALVAKSVAVTLGLRQEVRRVELAPLRDGSLVAEALCDALDVTPLPGVTPLQAAAMFLAPRTALVILDNCEHLLKASAIVVDELHRACPKLTVLSTSRAPLGIEGEHAWRVPSLSLPPDRAPDGLEVLGQADAVRLLIDRARQVRPNFEITTANAPAIAQICFDLDGIPLAIELAAARVRVLAVEQIAAGLTDRFRLLTGSVRGALPRQQTLRASVDWSHELLSEDEQLLLRRLGAFVGGWTLETCEQVCADDKLPRLAVLDLLTALVDRSLIQVDEHGGAVRYRFLETVRQYALERLDAAHELEAVRDRHCNVMLAVAEEIAPQLIGADQDRWLALLDADSANLAAALEHALTADLEVALRLCLAQTVLWKLRGRYVEAEASYARALDAAGERPTPLRARVLWARSYLASYAGEFEAAVPQAEAALAIAQELGEHSTAARALDVLATLQMFPDPVGAVGTAEASIALAREAGDDWCRAEASQIAAFSWMFQERRDELERQLHEIDELVEALGHREFIAWQQLGLSYRYYQQGDLERFRAGLERALQAAREVGEPTTESAALAQMAAADIEQGRANEALATLDETLELVIRTGTAIILPRAELYHGWALAALGRHTDAFAVLSATLEGPAAGYAWVVPALAWLLARLQLELGHIEEARARAQEVLVAVHSVPNPWHEARGHHVLARIESAGSRWAEAERHAHACLDLLADHDLALDYAIALDALAEAAAGLGSHEEATRLLGATERARKERGLARWVADEEHFETLAATLQEVLGESEFAETLAEGRELTTLEAIAWARRARGARTRPSGGWESLTPTS